MWALCVQLVTGLPGLDADQDGIKRMRCVAGTSMADPSLVYLCMAQPVCLESVELHHSRPDPIELAIMCPLDS